jgi:hypothetical protein
MRTGVKFLAALTLVVFGYVLGASQALSPATLLAQADAKKAAGETSGGPSQETQDKLKAASDALKTAMEALQNETLYNPATQGMNAFAVLAGGLNSREDLERGRGVDPETFAALYAGLATDEIAAEISRDTEGRVTYKGKVVRMYPISRIKGLYASRAALTGEELPGLATDPSKPRAKKAGEAAPPANGANP